MADTPAVIVELLDNGYTPSEIGRVFRDWGALLALGIGPDEWARDIPGGVRFFAIVLRLCIKWRVHFFNCTMKYTREPCKAPGV